MTIRLVCVRAVEQLDFFDRAPLVVQLIRFFAPMRFNVTFNDRGATVLTPVQEGQDEQGR